MRNCPQSWSDYNSAPLTVKTVGGVLILPPATLSQADAPPEAPAERSGQTAEKNRLGHAEHARTASGHAGTGRPRRPPKPSGGSTGGQICKPSRHRNGLQRATGNAIHGSGGNANATRKRRTGTGRKKNKAG